MFQLPTDPTSTSGVTNQSMRYLNHAAIAVCAIAVVSTARSQQQPSVPSVPGYTVEVVPLPSSATVAIAELPLEVDIDQAEKFVKIGFGFQVLGKRSFQSTQFLTPTLSTRQASQLVQLVPEYGSFHGDLVAKALLLFTGRVSGVRFGREGSPVLYIDLPYWTHQREGPIAKSAGVRIPEDENRQMIQELRKVFVDKLHAEEFSTDGIGTRTVRIWWHH
jgi:hypothetical protein